MLFPKWGYVAEFPDRPALKVNLCLCHRMPSRSPPGLPGRLLCYRCWAIGVGAAVAAVAVWADTGLTRLTWLGLFLPLIGHGLAQAKWRWLDRNDLRIGTGLAGGYALLYWRIVWT